jgi:hypothetical protein
MISFFSQNRKIGKGMRFAAFACRMLQRTVISRRLVVADQSCRSAPAFHVCHTQKRTPIHSVVFRQTFPAVAPLVADAPR